jgi:CheY-like chemotaxis protein
MNRERLLVVEDEDGVRLSMARTLTNAGYRVDGASSGLEALATLGTQEFDLLLVDLVMPGLDGIQLLEEVHKLDHRAGVLVITGYASLEYAKQSIDLGAIGFMMKPFSSEELIDGVENAFSTHISYKEAHRLLAYEPILELGLTLSNTNDAESMARAFLSIAVATTGAAHAVLYLRDGDKLTLVCAQGDPVETTPPGPDTIAQLEAVLREGSLSYPVQGAACTWPDLLPLGDQLVSWVCLSLSKSDRVKGLVLLGHQDGGTHFSRSDIQFLWIASALFAPVVDDMAAIKTPGTPT